jgi:hypothetical protein
LNYANRKEYEKQVMINFPSFLKKVMEKGVSIHVVNSKSGF